MENKERIWDRIRQRLVRALVLSPRGLLRDYATTPAESISAQVAAFCSSLTARKELCKVSKVTSEISAFVQSKFYEESRRYEDIFWPLRDGGAEAYTDGYRFFPPEQVPIVDEKQLPATVLQHHKQAKHLLRSAENCGFCELIKFAIIMDAFRKKDFPYDKCKEPLLNIVSYISAGKGSNVFGRLIRDLRARSQPIYLMLSNERGFGEMTLNRASERQLNFIRILWQRSAEYIVEEDRKVVKTRLNIFASRGG